MAGIDWTKPTNKLLADEVALSYIRNRDRENQFRNPEREYMFSAEDRDWLAEMGVRL